MRMDGEYRIPASRETVWKALNDPETLKNSIPGCEELEQTTENSFAARIVAKIGPVKAKFSTNVELADLDPPNGYTLTGKGQGGAAGFANGSANVKLEEDGGETVLRYTVDATVGGKLAQVGSRLVDAAARKMAEEFFSAFIQTLETAAPDSVKTPEPHPAPGLPPQVWVAGIIAFVIILLFLFAW